MVSGEPPVLHVTAEDVLDRVARAGGHLVLTGLNREELRAWRHAARVAQLRLWRVGTARLRKWTNGDSLYIVVTDPATEPTDETAPEADGTTSLREPVIARRDFTGREVKVPAKLPTSPHPLVETLKKGLEVRENHRWRPAWQRAHVEDWIPDIPRQKKGRLLRILQAIIEEAKFRGYSVREAGQVGGRHLMISTGWQADFPLALGGTTQRLWIKLQPQERRALTCSDTKTQPLERRLGQFFDRLEQLNTAAEERREEERRQAAERRRRWEEATNSARDTFAEQHRQQVLQQRINDMELANHIRAYSAALRDRAATLDRSRQQDVQAWADWATSYADHLGPRHTLQGMPTTPKPSPDDLKPYLRGWSPYGPG